MKKLHCYLLILLLAVPASVRGDDTAPETPPASPEVAKKGPTAPEWISLAAIRQRLFSDRDAMESMTMLLKISPESLTQAEQAQAKARVEKSQADLAKAVAKIDSKLTPENLKRFGEEQKQEAALTETRHAMRTAEKKEQPESPELAAKLKQQEKVVNATRSLISPYLRGASTPRDELDALVKRAIRDRD
jgi:hypothetical protein